MSTVLFLSEVKIFLFIEILNLDILAKPILLEVLKPVLSTQGPASITSGFSKGKSKPLFFWRLDLKKRCFIKVAMTSVSNERGVLIFVPNLEYSSGTAQAEMR